MADYFFTCFFDGTREILCTQVRKSILFVKEFEMKGIEMQII